MVANLSEPVESVLARRARVKETAKNGNGFGLTLATAVQMWPTPSATDYKGSPQGGALEARQEHSRGVRLPEEVMRRYLPTPGCPRPHDSENTAGKFMPGQNQQDLTAAVARNGGQLNPDWVEWLMGWPIGWTDLKPMETDKFRQWLSAHGQSL